MPRRIPDYNLIFADWNMVSSIGAFIYGHHKFCSCSMWFAQLLLAKPTTEAKTWDGAEGLEWTVPSPAPYHTFSVPPPEVKVIHSG
jgi:cytochrome c oxidase subunit 1